MKNPSLTNSKSSLLLVLLSLCFFISARASKPFIPLDNKSSVAFAVTIPDEWNGNIVKEETDNAVNYKFKRADGSLLFLFSINKVADMIWMSIKDQLTDYKMLEHKNGNIYYCQCTTKSKIKGADSELYAKIYSSLGDIIKTVRITD